MAWSDRVSKIAAGDRVAYKASFLRGIGATTGEMPFLRGEVTEIRDLGGIQLATIKWDNQEEPGRVAVGNLSKVTTRGVADE